MKNKESLFSKAADIIVNQISPQSGYHSGDLISVFRPDESDKMVLMRLVIKTTHNGWFSKSTQYRLSDFTLSDIISQGKPPLNPDVSEKVLGPYKGTFRYNHSGKLVAKVVQHLCKIEGQGSDEAELKLSPVTVKKETVNVKELRESKNRCNMQNDLVQQMQEAKKAPKCPHVLALLTERVVTTNSWEICETWKCTGGAEAGAVDTVDTTVKVLKSKDHSITIDAGTVIAYGLRKLDIKDGYLVFPEPALQLDGDIESDSLLNEDLDSTELQNLGKHLPPLAELPQSTRSALFQRFCEVMKDRDALSDVENTLEEWSTGIAPVVTERNASVSHRNSASAILDLLRPDPDSHMASKRKCMGSRGYMESDSLGCPGTPGGPLTAAHLLVSAMEALPDEALSLLSECSPDILKASNVVLNKLDLKDQKKSVSSLPLESLPLPLQNVKAFRWVQQLLIASNVNLRRESEELLAERKSEPGVLPLVLCVTVQGLSYLL